MKTTSFFKSAWVLAAAAIVTGCSQDEILDTPQNGTTNVLKVNVIDDGFTPVDNESRAVDNGTSTTFEAGTDKIGVYIVDADESEVIAENVCLTRSASGWDGTLYYYEGADYIAYYPYDAAMKDVKSVTDIETYFKNNKYTMTQSTQEAYRNCDLMTGTVTADAVTENGTITFSMKHNMALLEFAIPTYSYRVSDEAGAFKYAAPLGLTLKMGEDEITPYPVSTGVYRCIVSPTATDATLTVKGNFTDAKENMPVKFEKANITLAANAYQHYSVEYTATDGTTKVTSTSLAETVRPLAVGDYYYADGTICPGDFKAIKKNCIGMIFSTTTNNETASDGTVCNHGYVMALINARNSNASTSNSYGYTWGIDHTSTDFIALNLTAKTALEASTDLDGKKYTEALGTLSMAIYDAIDAAKKFGTKDSPSKDYAAPTFTTDWFLPSAGQLALIVNNFATLNGQTGFSDSSVQIAESTSSATVAKDIKDRLEKVGGGLRNDSETYHYWWSSNVASEANCVAQLLEISDGGKFQIWATASSRKALVRPILAF